MAPVALFSALAQYVCERQETMAAVTCAGLTEVDAALADAANDAETPIAAASAASLRETFIVYYPFPRPFGCLYRIPPVCISDKRIRK